MKARPTPQYLSDVRRKWEHAWTRAEKKRIIENAALAIGYTYRGFVMLLNLNQRKRSLTDKETLRMQEIDQYARKVYDLKMKITHDGKNATIGRAYLSLVKDGQIPSHVTVKQIYRACERLHLNNESIAPHGETKRDHPLSCFQIDFTKSVYFHFNARGDIFFQKNYYTKKHESRLWIGAAIDMCTRVCYMEYFLASGENASFVQDVMLRTFEEKVAADSFGEICGHDKLLQGMPREIYIDRGAGGRSEETKKMLKKLGIGLIIGANMRDRKGNLTTISNKRARGMVEKLIGDFKRDLETGLAHEHEHGKLPPEITLGFLNDRLREWCIEHNESAHPKFKTSARWDLFEDVLEKAEYPPDDARSFATGRIMRIVIQRLIQAKANAWYVAPIWANDGDELEIVNRGKKVFVFCKSGELEELVPQSVVRAAIEEEEAESDSYDGIELKSRFNDALKFYSDGEVVISKLSESLKDDKIEFFSKARSPEEIRVKAQYFIMASAQSKVIHYKEREIQ